MNEHTVAVMLTAALFISVLIGPCGDQAALPECQSIAGKSTEDLKLRDKVRYWGLGCKHVIARHEVLKECQEMNASSSIMDEFLFEELDCAEVINDHNCNHCKKLAAINQQRIGWGVSKHNFCADVCVDQENK